MGEVTVRQIHGEEVIEAMAWMPPYAFRPSPPLPDRSEREQVIAGRKGVTYVAAYDGEEVLATAAGSHMTQNVRGVTYPMSGIWGVVTHPGYRRQGHSREVLSELLSILRRDGYPLSCLYPFRESFYERLGYVTFHLPKVVHLKPAALLPALKMDLAGEVQMELIADGYEAYRGYLQAMQEATHGMALFDHVDLERVRDNNIYWLAQARAAGELVGLMLYDLKGEQVTQFKLRAIRFYYSDPLGRYLLLAWIAKHTDQASEVELWLPPEEVPETWIADLQLNCESAERAPMGRVLDVAGLDGMQVGPGAFSARILDPVCPWNEAIWKFESVDGVLHTTAGSQEDCTLSIQALSSLIYGIHDPADFAYRGWGDPSAPLQRVMGEMFPKASPYIHEYF